MHLTKKISLILALSFSLGNLDLFAQPTSSPDCVTAPTICGNTNVTFVGSSGSGMFVDFTTATSVSNPQTSPAGIVPVGGSGCFLGGEINPHFLIFTCQSPGTLMFSIAAGPGVQLGCYDWTLWNYTAATCAGISGNTLPPVRCCWNSACSGGTGIGTPIPAGASANNFGAALNVNCGDRFILCISNYSSVNATVPINFFGTAVISCAPVGTPLAVNNATICSGGTATLIVTGGTGTATWTPGPSVTNTLIVSPSATTTYTANKPGGCGTGTITATVSVVPTPTITATNNSPVCAGTAFGLFGTGGGTYSWAGPGGFTSTAQNPVIPVSTTGHSGSYTLTVSNGACTTTSVTNVTVNPNPTPVAGNTGPYCPGATIQLNVGASASYTWTGPNSFNSNLQNPTIPAATTAMGGVYTVTVTNAQGCKGVATTNVIVNPSPAIVIGSNSPICAGNPLNLTSTGGGTYSWTGPNAFTSTLQNPTIPVTSAVNTGVYSVTVTNAGCTSTANVNVTINTPTSTASNTGPYCAGQTINLSTPAATSFTWSGPGGYSSSVQNPNIPSSTTAMTGVYSVTASTSGCVSTATTMVTVNPVPVVAPGNTGPYCVGNTIQLNVGASNSYTWTGPAFNSNLQNPTISNAQTTNGGVYTVSVTNAQGCSAFATTNVVVNALPTIVVNNPTTCVNTTINLTSNGGVTYSWSGPGGFTSAAQNPNIPSAQLTMSGAYVVTVTNASGCVNTATANVSVLPVPTPNAAGNSPVCAGGTLNLFGSGGASYAWSGPGYTGSNQNPTINNVTASASGVYTLLVSSGSCTASTTYTVVINPLPVFNFTGSNVMCNGQSNGTSTVNVTVGTGPFNYNWSTIPSQTSQNASNLAAGTYTCVVTDANGCTSMASTQITQPTAFSVSINSATFSACANTPINVTAIGAGGTGPYNYNWVSGPATSGYSINETLAGNYIYTVNATDAFNCPATDIINLTFFPQPTVTATSATVCAGQPAVVTASGANTYVWQPGNITGPTYPYSGNTSINVSVVGTANGCSNSANTNIMVNPIPNSNISLGNAKGCVPACVTFTAGSSSSIQSYNWILNGAGITGSVNGAYCFDEAAQYTLGLTVMDAFGCTSTVVPVTIDIYAQPVADFNHAPIKPIINIDQYVTFTDASWGATIVSWNWYFMNTAQYTSVEQNPTFAYTEPGTYPVVLVVKSDQGCYDTLIRPLVVGEDFGIYVPNAFTPNGDGLNDIFQPKGFGVVKYELNIFDRWGEKVFSTKDFEQGWDGTMQSKKDVKYGILENGVYSWLIEATSVFGKSHELKGHVTLMK